MSAFAARWLAIGAALMLLGVLFGAFGAHVAAVQAQHHGLGGAGQEPVGPDRRVRPGEGQPADRVDALVWALSELMLGGGGPAVFNIF